MILRVIFDFLINFVCKEIWNQDNRILNLNFFKLANSNKIFWLLLQKNNLKYKKSTQKRLT